ncbi:hypothetical protein M409DRAFT_59301 [Zasmidium cellare ATCC 36951]|uniref:Uncharacterized protein n=1 Tax=Zasmidium cellare ATCC 36951 TaxID=1080233 RepID=A0A6A6C2H5_ZASCE|nr:uncharacterized protein M409DRAFT_59301 [Zasmidium cellare ATCC 36951]KAF2161304.1 hypothetical protein M409DRAFT_59301 [Zasmidium cellare ATCC 36951]
MAGKFTQYEQGRTTSEVGGHHDEAPQSAATPKASSNKRSRTEAGLTQDSAATGATSPAKRAKLTLPAGSQREGNHVSPAGADIPTAESSTEPAGQSFDLSSRTLYGETWEEWAHSANKLCADLGLPNGEEEISLAGPAPLVEPFIGPPPTEEGFDLSLHRHFAPMPAPAPRPAPETIDLTGDDEDESSSAAAAQAAPETIDLTRDDSSPSSSPVATPLAPQSAPQTVGVPRRSPAEAAAAHANHEKFLREQQEALRAEQVRTGFYDGPANINGRRRREHHRKRMEDYRAEEERRRAAAPVPRPSQEALERQERETLETLEKRRIAHNESNKRYRERVAKDKADKAKAAAAAAAAAGKADSPQAPAAPSKGKGKQAAKKGASPAQQVEASPAVVAGPSSAPKKQGAGARRGSGESSQSELTPQGSSQGSGSGSQTPVTSPDEVDEDAMAAEIARAFAAEEVGESEVAAEIARAFAQDGEGEQAVKGDDSDSLFGESELNLTAQPTEAEAGVEENDGADLFGEGEQNFDFSELFGEDEQPAAAAEPAEPAPKAPRLGMCLPFSRKETQPAPHFLLSLIGGSMRCQQHGQVTGHGDSKDPTETSPRLQQGLNSPTYSRHVTACFPPPSPDHKQGLNSPTYCQYLSQMALHGDDKACHSLHPPLLVSGKDQIGHQAVARHVTAFIHLSTSPARTRTAHQSCRYLSPTPLHREHQGMTQPSRLAISSNDTNSSSKRPVPQPDGTSPGQQNTGHSLHPTSPLLITGERLNSKQSYQPPGRARSQAKWKGQSIDRTQSASHRTLLPSHREYEQGNTLLVVWNESDFGDDDETLE